jgi:hypothetical protein
MTFKELANKLTSYAEARGFPLKKLRDVESEQTNILVCCDHLQEMGFDEKPLDVKNLAYLKPLSNRLAPTLAKRFPHLEILRRGGGSMPAQIWYTMFNRELLEAMCKFLHISEAKHIFSDVHLNDYDFLRNFDPDELKQIAQQALSVHPEMFRKNLTGPTSKRVARAALDMEIWDWEHYHVLTAILPHERMSKNAVFDELGLTFIANEVAARINKKWGAHLEGKYLINRIG